MVRRLAHLRGRADVGLGRVVERQAQEEAKVKASAHFISRRFFLIFLLIFLLSIFFHVASGVGLGDRVGVGLSDRDPRPIFGGEEPEAGSCS